MSDGWPAEPFWTFSLELYARPGVERACLHLQDRRGLDVNLVLLCCWLGTRGRSLDPVLLGQVRESVADWRVRVIQPLREVRRTLKDRVQVEPDLVGPVERMRRAVQGSELDAEHLEQVLLARGVRSVPDRGSPGPGCTAASLALLATFGRTDRPALRCLLEQSHPDAPAADLEAALRRLSGAA